MPAADVHRHLDLVEAEATESTFADYQRTIVTCSKVLLGAYELTEIDEALAAIREVVGASSVFVEVNEEDPVLGLCSTMVRELSADGSRVDDPTWQRVPWSRMPSSFAKLSVGEPFGFLVSELDDVEAQLYQGLESESELDVPVFSAGKWVGLIGVSDEEPRSWKKREIRLLVAAAEMLGAFWERRKSRKALQRSLSALETRLRYEEALIECSRALLSTPDDDSAIETALQALMPLTSARYGFVERNEDVTGLGLCSRVAHLHDPDALVEQYWEVVPWSKMPDSYARLSRGQVFAFSIDDLGPTEREQYANSPYPIASEINIPIMVEGKWEGLVGFTDPESVMSWEPEEIAMLQTAADMIGSYWARSRDRRELADLVQSKDDFVAAVSHELRTPLTAIVGLSAEMRDYADRFEPAELGDFVTLIAEQSSELASIVDDLLVASRLESEDIQVHPSMLDARAEIQAVLAGLSLRDVEVTGNAVAWADPGRFRQIVRNLLTNARRYGGDTIRVDIVDVQERCVVRVIDDGEGIAPDDAEAIFEPYRALQHAVTQPDSIGLGLAVSRRLAHLMDGDLRYAREGSETVFSLGLPKRA